MNPSLSIEERFRSVYVPLKRKSLEREIAAIMAMPPAEQDVNALNELLQLRNLYSR